MISSLCTRFCHLSHLLSLYTNGPKTPLSSRFIPSLAMGWPFPDSVTACLCVLHHGPLVDTGQPLLTVH